MKAGTSPTRRYHLGGPRRKPNSSRGRTKQELRGKCRCTRPRVLKRIDDEPPTSSRRQCTRCFGETVERGR